MKVTGFKLLKEGIAGIEVEGVDLVDSGNNRVMFRDAVKRIRRFPLSLVLRQAVAVLNYPFLVGTEHWRSEFAQVMKDDFSAPDKVNGNPHETLFKTLVSFWESTSIIKCSIEKGNYKIAGEIHCEMATVKATVTIAPNDDHSLYTFVETAIEEIVRLIEQALTVPMSALGSGEQIREIMDQISNETDAEIKDDMDPDDAFLILMKTANKKGYGVVLDDNMLAQLAASTEPDADVDPFEGIITKDDEGQGEDLQPEIESVDEEGMAELKSLQTKDDSIFEDRLKWIEGVDEEKEVI